MGVDMTVTIEIEDDDHQSLLRFYVCEVWCGRFYHWRDACFLDGSGGEFDFRQLRNWRDHDIHAHTVKDTDLYLIMRALAKRYGKRHVRAVWSVS